jgi:hypothetical protein
MAVWIINMGEFKKNITIKNGWNARNILNMECIVIQFFQLQGVVGGKRHFFRQSMTLKKKRGKALRQLVERIGMEH